MFCYCNTSDGFFGDLYSQLANQVITKVNFDLTSMSRTYPSSTTQGQTVKRKWTKNSYAYWLSANNYYTSTNSGYSTSILSKDGASVLSGYGYGLAVIIDLLPGKTYLFMCSVDVANAGMEIAYYQSDGTSINYSDPLYKRGVRSTAAGVLSYLFTVPQNASYVVFIFYGASGVTENTANFTNIMLYLMPS